MATGGGLAAAVAEPLAVELSVGVVGAIEGGSLGTEAAFGVSASVASAVGEDDGAALGPVDMHPAGGCVAKVTADP